MPFPHIAHLSKDKKLLPILQTVEPYLLKRERMWVCAASASVVVQQNILESGGSEQP